MAHRLIAEIDLSDEQTRWISDLRNKYVWTQFSREFTFLSQSEVRYRIDYRLTCWLNTSGAKTRKYSQV